MKRLNLIFLSLFLMLGQWGSLDHVYHEHESVDVCEFCLSSQSLEHALTTSVSSIVVLEQPYRKVNQARLLFVKDNIHYFSVRAPPRFI